MSIVLGRYLNYRFVQLGPDTKGEQVGVLCPSGEYHYVRWLGFVTRDEAKVLGKPVRLEVSRIGRSGDFGAVWEDVPKGKHVQGCLTRHGAYAVMVPSVRVV
jgi:hypothetical protein